MTRTRSTRLPRALAVAGATLAVALGSTACSAPESGAAAVVDGHRISVADVQQASADFEKLTGQPVQQQQMLYFLVIGPYVLDGAAKAGIGVSPSDAEQQFAGKVDDPSEASIEAMQTAQAVSRLNQLTEDKAKPVVDAVVGRLRAADIELSPRYGSFDPERLAVVPLQQNWFATPAPAESPAP